MSNLILYIATSLDGFIARKDGNIDWLDKFNDVDYGYEKFYETIGSIIMGSKTYEQILTFGEWPYNGVDCYVVTKKNFNDERVHFYNDSLEKLVENLKSKNEKDIWLVGGSKLVKSFLNAHLIDKIELTIVPELIHEGIPLFNDMEDESSLKLTNMKSYSNGLAQLSYEFIK